MSDEKHPEIPEGVYCYEIIEIVKRKGKFPKIKTRLCPHWHSMPNRGAYCSLINEYSEYQDWDNLLWDQCKECEFKR